MSFLRNYAICTGGNEAPPIYHIWSGISALSAIVSRRVWVEQGIFIYYPNIYVVLVGSPGGGKSTAMNVAKRLVREVKDIPLAATAITKEALVRYMSEEESPCQKSWKDDEGHIIQYCPMTIFATELTHFMAVNPIGMIDFLTTIYDEPVYEVKTKHQGDDLIEGPYITLLGCMTPDITSNFIKMNIITGGFARRSIFVWAGGRGKPVAWPTVTHEQKVAWKFCLDWAQQLKKVKGQFRWSTDAREWYTKWYENHKLHVLPTIKDPMVAGYFESKHVQMIKVAMLIALSESLELTLEINHLTAALGFLEEAEQNLHRVFEGTGKNELAKVASKIVETIDRIGQPVPIKQLRLVFFRDAMPIDFDKVKFHLLTTDQVVECEEKRPGGIVIPMLATPAIATKWAREKGARVVRHENELSTSSSAGQNIAVDLSSEQTESEKE